MVAHNNPPEPPLEPPPRPREPAGSWVSTILTLLLLAGALVALVLVSLGSILGPLLFLLLTLPAIALMHYLLWGWWLGKMIQESEQEDETD